MVRRADGDGVDLVSQVFEHLAVVEVLFRLGVLLPHLVEDIAVDVAEGDDFAVSACVVGVAISFSAHADASESHLLIWRLCGRSAGGRAAQEQRARTGQSGFAEKFTTVHGGDSGGEDGGCTGTGMLGGAGALVRRRVARRPSVPLPSVRRLFQHAFPGGVRNPLPRMAGEFLSLNTLAGPVATRSLQMAAASTFVSGDGLEQGRHTFKQGSQGRRGLLGLPRSRRFRWGHGSP